MTSIREPGSRPRMGSRLPDPERPGSVPPARRVAPAARVTPGGARKPRPDPGPLRIAIGLTGLATSSALLTAFLTPAVATSSATVGGTTADVSGVTDQLDGIRHLTRVVQLAPGQTAPPDAVVQQPAPRPQRVLVRSRQSGG